MSFIVPFLFIHQSIDRRERDEREIISNESWTTHLIGNISFYIRRYWIHLWKETYSFSRIGSLFGFWVCGVLCCGGACHLCPWGVSNQYFYFFELFLNRLHTCPPNYRLLLPFAGNDVDVVVTQQLSRTETSLYLWQLHMGAIGVPLSVSFDASLVPFCFVFSNLLAASPLQQKLAFNSIFKKKKEKEKSFFAWWFACVPLFVV